MDGDVAYSNQHDDFAPVPVMGSDVVLDVETYPVTAAFDASESWVPGSTIKAYLWSASAGSWDDNTSATPTLTVNSYPANGLIRISCRVTSNNGDVQTTGYRFVRVYDADNPAETVFRLTSFEGDYETGGWSFQVTMLGDVSDVRDRTPVLLFARDYHDGTTREEIGQQADRENIVCSGWVDGETIQFNPEENSVTFSVKGPQFWLGKMPGFPPGVERQTGSTGSWATIPNLTVDRALWHLLHWRSTASTVMDVLLTGDTRNADVFEVSTESLWGQIKEIAGKILAGPGCDRYGRLFVEIEPQLVPVADRTWTEVMTITEADWIERITYQRNIVDPVSLLDLSGVAIPGLGLPAKPYFSLATGHLFKRYGSIQTRDRLLLNTQAEANELAGLDMGRINNPYPRMEIPISTNNRICLLYTSRCV